MIDEGKLRAFGAFIVRLQQRGNLSRAEAREASRQILFNEVPELSQGAFIAAMHCKGETQDEIIGLTESLNEDWNYHLKSECTAPEPVLGLVGVGMDSLKTVNVSSGAAIIAAACGVYVYKVGAPGMTGVSGSAQVFALLGVDSDGPFERALAAVGSCRLAFTSVVGQAVQKTGVFRVLSQLRCATPIHIAGPMGFHGGERHKILGVPHPSQVRMVCEAMKQVGYRRALVPCGGSDEHPGKHLDELSNIGTTHIAELHEDGTITEYDVRPEEAGLELARYQDIASARTLQENVRSVARVLSGRQTGPVLDLLALNAASCLTLMGKAKSLAEGVAKAREAVLSGQAYEQIRALIRAQNRDPEAGLRQLEALSASA